MRRKSSVSQGLRRDHKHAFLRSCGSELGAQEAELAETQGLQPISLRMVKQQGPGKTSSRMVKTVGPDEFHQNWPRMKQANQSHNGMGSLNQDHRLSHGRQGMRELAT
ncbi:uncharacterized protein UBRO_21073 [Ustilago bromivora]|uniref:Uncharacterized protein n=1 Tax=Ustilago bromivora TaxID=307758 RepID=A0A1K0G7C0_9BASI|nr:uncharacterized protein UBRO_21073 [Ustilago bromivora]